MEHKLSRLVKNTLTYGIGNVIVKSAYLFLLPIFTAYLSPAEYGISALLSWMNFLLIPILSLGLGTSMAPVYFENRNSKEICVWTTFTLAVASSVSLATVGIIFSSSISNFLFQTELQSYLVIISLITMSLTISVTPFMLFMQFEERARAFVVLTIIGSFTTVLLSVLMVVVLKKGIQGLIESQLLGQVVVFTLFASAAVRKLGKYYFRFETSKKLLKVGIPLIPSSFLVFLLFDGNKILLKTYHGIEELGIYNIGFNIGLVMSILVSGFQSAWIPYFMSFVDKRDEAKALFRKIMTYYIFIFGSIALLFFICAKFIVYGLTQPEFHDAYKIVGLSATAQFLIGVFAVLLPSIYYAKHVPLVSIIQFFCVAVAIPINYFLVKNFGKEGTALAIMLNAFILVVFTQIWNYMHKRTYFIVRYQWHRIFYFSAAFVIIAFISLSFNSLTIWSEFFKTLLLTSLLIFTIFILLTPSEKQALVNFKKL